MAHSCYKFSSCSRPSHAGYKPLSLLKKRRRPYERDSQGRILVKNQWVNDNPSSPSLFKVSYGYANGELASLTYPSGLKVFYRRTAGRITSIDVKKPGANKPTEPWVTALAYTALGQPKAWSWSSGDSAARVFDTDGRMVSNEFASYIYDAASRITGITQNVWASSTATGTVSLYTTPLSWSAGYDARNRLTNFTRAGASTNYSYDPNSNRLTAVDKITSDTDLDGEFDDADFSQSTSQALNIDQASNKLLGFTQTVTKVRGTRTLSTVNTQVNYALDANGAMTSDGLRDFEYDPSNRLAKVRVIKDGEAAKVSYLTNALGQRVFKGEYQAEQTLPNEQDLGPDFVTWLKKQFGWLFTQAQANTSIGTAYIYDEEANLLGEYDNGSALGAGRTEYIWLPTESGQPVPIGFFRNGKFFAIHADHLGTPRLVTNDANTPVWQWPYSAFGANKPTGVLKATPNPKAAITNIPVLLKATGAAEVNLRFPGQYFDVESNLSYNYFRSYNGSQGRYSQPDPIGLEGGLNRYGYVAANPLSFTDLLGLDHPGMGSYDPKESSMSFWRGVPKKSCTCMNGPDTFYSRPGTNFTDVHKAGRAAGRNLEAIKKNIGQWGTFDVQRDVDFNQFTGAYTSAANFAVGVYMHGAGYGRTETFALGKTYAFFKSKNWDDPNLKKYWYMGWDAAEAGNLEFVCLE